MKKILFLALFSAFIFIMDASAQTYKYHTTKFSYKAKDEYGYWSDWSDWKKTRCLISISLDREVINIYSDSPQEFDIIGEVGDREDENGSSIILSCVDKDGLRCNVRLRRQHSGVLQLYIEYNDFIYVYCLKPKK